MQAHLWLCEEGRQICPSHGRGHRRHRRRFHHTVQGCHRPFEHLQFELAEKWEHGRRWSSSSSAEDSAYSIEPPISKLRAGFAARQMDSYDVSRLGRYRHRRHGQPLVLQQLDNLYPALHRDNSGAG